MVNKATIGIGPATTLPSWEWIGKDTATELRKYFNVTIFKTKPPRCDVAIFIKIPPSLESVQRQKIIYCPVDYFQSTADIIKLQPVLENCLILSHSRRLIPLLGKAEPIDHHLKYTTPEINSYKQKGFILWSGGYAHTPHLFKFLNTFPLPRVKLLTNFKNQRERQVAASFGVKEKPEVEIELWTPQRQREILSEAKAAIDIKGETFSQMHRPPTKIQQYVCAGLPTAVNESSESFEYLKNLGLEVATPKDVEYWFSVEYYKKTAQIAKMLRNKLSLKSIGLEYKKHILTLL